MQTGAGRTAEFPTGRGGAYRRFSNRQGWGQPMSGLVRRS